MVKRVQERVPEPYTILDRDGNVDPQSLQKYLEELVRVLRFNYDNAEVDQEESLLALDTDSIPEGVNLYFTEERVDDRVGSLLTEGVGIDLTYDDGADSLEIAAELATQGEAEAGTDNTVLMTPLRTQQLIDQNLAGLIDEQVFTSSGTWTKPEGCTKVIVEVVGAGGGGGFSPSVSSGQIGYGVGGGGGGYGLLFIDSGIGSTETVTVGIGGTGGTSGSTTGGTGGTSSFGSFLTCTGGAGGGGNGSSSLAYAWGGAVGGSSSGGDVNIDGGYSLAGFYFEDSGTARFAIPSIGGTSLLGSLARQDVVITNGRMGADGVGFGSGGTGGTTLGSVFSYNGGSGTDGLVIVRSYA